MEVAASVVGLLMAGAHISHMIQEFGSSIKNVPALAQQLNNEVQHFCYILQKVQQTVIDSDTLDSERAALIDINHLASALTAAVCTFSELEKELTRIKASGRIDFWDRVKWLRAEKNLLNISVRLNRHETSLTLIFTIITSESLNRALSSKERLSSAFDAESIAASQASTDDSMSSISTSTTASSASFGGHQFDPALSSSRAYRRVSDSDSIFSVDTLRTRFGRWSMYTAYSNDSVFSMPISLRETSGVTLADKAVGPVLLPITVDTIYQHDRYRQVDSQVPAENRKVPITRTPPFALHSAAEEGRHQEVRDLLRRGVDVLEVRGKDETALYLAVLNQHELTVKVLLLSNQKLELRVKERRRLWLALTRGRNPAIISAVFEKYPISTLHRTEIIEIIRCSINTNDPAILSSVLEKAGMSPEFDRILEEVLLTPALSEASAALLVTSAIRAGFSKDSAILQDILCTSIRYRYLTVTKVLLKGGVYVNNKDQSGKTLLHIAVEKGGIRSVDLLINHGADTEIQDSCGQTPIFSATNNIVLKRLLEAGASVTTRGFAGDTVLHHAALHWSPVPLGLLLDRTDDINVRNENFETILHLAVRRGDFEIVHLLVDRGADIEAKDRKGYTPLLIAIVNCKEGIARILLLLGADVNASDIDGNTSLIESLNIYITDRRLGCDLLVLLKNGANINAANNFGKTALHLAAQVDNPYLVNELCKRGADTLARDSKGHTPAQCSKSSSVVELISKWSASRSSELILDAHDPIIPPPQISDEPAPSETKQQSITAST